MSVLQGSPDTGYNVIYSSWRKKTNCTTCAALTGWIFDLNVRIANVHIQVWKKNKLLALMWGLEDAVLPFSHSGDSDAALDTGQWYIL